MKNDIELALEQFEDIERYGRKMRLAAEGWDSPWKILIAIILSARNRDEVTIEVCEKFFDKFDRLEKIAFADIEAIRKGLSKINFFENKSKYVKETARILLEEYNGAVPGNIEELVKLPGVGRKTANVFLSELGKDTIGVDTHVSYISQKMGWTSSKNPDKIEKDLMKLFPKNYWRKINPVLVRFGKTYVNRREKDRIIDRINNK